MKHYGIIFDLDGTLADTLEDIRSALNVMLIRFGYPTVTPEKMYRIINRGARRLVFDALPEGTADSPDDTLVSEALEEYSKAYLLHPLVHTHPYEGIPEALQALKTMGFSLAVLSNKQDALVKQIVGALFPSVFDTVAGQSVFPTKPCPQAALALAEEMHLCPDNCFFCGDSDIDMKTGVNAGMRPVGVLWGYRSRSILEEAGSIALADAPAQLPVIFKNLISLI